MTDQQFAERIALCERPADFEKLLYDHANGRMSRSDAKALVSTLFRLTREEIAQERKQQRQDFLHDLLTVKRDFYQAIANG